MRILLTSYRLHHYGGAVTYLRDLTGALIERGHQPILYSRFLGPAADGMRRLGAAVVDDPAMVGEPPDIIHGQHHLATIEALTWFPGVPAVFFCHGWLPWQDMPPRFPRILRYVAVDGLRRERLVSEQGIAPDMVEVIPNFVDTKRFAARTQPLPARPRRALVFSNQAITGRGWHEAVARACAGRGIEVETAGKGAGRNIERPEEILGGYDLVFGRGRAALEAMAMGCAVILCDVEGLGPLVTVEQMEDLTAANFGVGVLRGEVTVEQVASRIDRYDPDDAALVSKWVHENAGLEAAVDRVIGVYERVVADWSEQSATYDPSLEPAAISRYLAALQTRTIPAIVREVRQGQIREQAEKRAVRRRARRKAKTAKPGGRSPRLRNRVRSRLASIYRAVKGPFTRG